jgi:hypothetical protein
MKAGEVVHPQPDGLPWPGHQLARETPADADIAEIIDDRAEYVPGARHGKV